jgi:K+ transporter
LAHVNLGKSPFLASDLGFKVHTPQALFGTSLTMADGVLTAAVSVTSAVGGIGESFTECQF